MSPHTEQSGLDLSTLQSAFLESLRGHVPPEHVAHWFRDVELIACDGTEFVFQVPSGFIRDWIRRNFLSEVRASLRDVTGLHEVRATVRAAQRVPDASDAVAGSAGVEPAGSPQPIDSRQADSYAVDSQQAGELREISRSDQSAPAEAGPTRFDGNRNGDVHRIGSGALQIPSVAALQPPESDGGAPAEDASAVAAELRAADLDQGQRDIVAGGSVSTGGAVEFDSSAALNRNYTFETFVVGPCNRLSHAAALAASDNPGRAYNPLFVHGNVGLGKTHLLQAICQSVSRRREIRRVLYMSCEDFTNRFIHSIQAGRLDEFREFHRSVDVLVIDDVQFLANKEKTQEEFFHTFNALYNTNRQIIISSDRSPTEIPTVEERLVSRFKWGLVAEMEVPCFETRVAIVKRKARLRQVEIPDDVAFFIAKRIDTNIRELEGAVIKVLGVASITSRDLSVELTEEALKGVVVSRSRKLTMGDIMGLVTAHFSVSARELTGKGRTQAISLPRQICMYLCRQHTDQSLEEIGRFFGNRDHTTVIYALQRIKKRLKEDRVFHELVTTLGNRLHG